VLLSMFFFLNWQAGSCIGFSGADLGLCGLLLRCEGYCNNSDVLILCLGLMSRGFLIGHTNHVLGVFAPSYGYDIISLHLRR
jgi:hypothetical protein